MANEIKITTSLSWAKGGAQISVSGSTTVSQTGSTAIENVQIIQSTSEAIVFGDVTDPAYLVFKNLNALWATLSTTQQAAYAGESDYNTKNTVFVGTINPTIAATAVDSLPPGHFIIHVTTLSAWYACKATDNVNLLVIAIQR